MSPRWLLGIFMAALLLRLVAIAFLPSTPTFGDETDYMILGEDLVRTGEYPARPYRPPGYPMIVGAISLFTPNTYAGVRIFQAFVGAAAVVLVALLAARLFSSKTGILAGSVMAAYPLWIYTSTTAFPQTILAFLLYAALVLLTGASALKIGASAVEGGLIGVSMLLAPAYVVIIPAAILWLFLHPNADTRGAEHHRRAIIASLALVLGAGLVVLPWTARNWIATGEFIPISTNGAINLWLGNNPQATIDTKSHLNPYAVYGDALSQMTARERDLMLITEAKRFIASQPAQALTFTCAKFAAFFRPLPGKLRCDEESSTVKRLGTYAFATTWLVLLVTGVGGLVISRRRVPAVWLMLGVVVLFAAFHAVFFPAMRFRTPLDGIFAIWAATFVLTVAGRGLSSQGKPPR